MGWNKYLEDFLSPFFATNKIYLGNHCHCNISAINDQDLSFTSVVLHTENCYEACLDWYFTLMQETFYISPRNLVWLCLFLHYLFTIYFGPIFSWSHCWGWIQTQSFASWLEACLKAKIPWPWDLPQLPCATTGQRDNLHLYKWLPWRMFASKAVKQIFLRHCVQI